MSLIIVGGGDEAGRGAVIGPLVVAFVCVSKGKEKKFADIGVRDSKLLTKRKRSFLFDEIKNICDEVSYYEISNEEINKAMKIGISLNQLEAMHFARLVDGMKTKIDKLYIDSPDVIAERFGMRVSLFAKKQLKVGNRKGAGIKVISEHKADARYPVVSSASIIAKVIRDEAMENIEQKTGVDIGSGYPGDDKTIAAIKANFSTKELNPYIREYWRTLDNLRQRKMKDFSEVM